MPKLEMRREPIDVTYGGLFGGTADSHRVYVPGPYEYFIDGEKVTEDEFRQAVKDAGGPWPLHPLAGSS